MRHLLSLAGGGYLGLYSVRLLELLEDGGDPIGSRFDLIGGTSVGGLIALALAAGKSAAEVRKSIEDNGPRIFPWEQKARHRLFAPGHNASELATVVDGLIGSATLDDLKVPVVIPTFALTTGETRLFRTPHLPVAVADRRTPLRDIALATAAAPTYFAPHRIGNHDFADGGLAANAPDAIVATDALAMRWQGHDIRMLAVGTTHRSTATVAGSTKFWGITGWFRHQRLLATIMAAQMDLARQTAANLLEPRSILVADTQPGTEQAKALNLDKVDDISTATLLALAEAEFARIQRDRGLDVSLFRNHQPEAPYFFP